MGRLVSEKVPGVFIRAMAAVKTVLLSSALFDDDSIGSAVQGLVIGSGPLRAALKRLAASLGVLDVVTFVGQVSVQDVAQWMAVGDVLVNPRGEGETFGYVHVEAAASGIPVIAFDRYV